ncbi:MAG: toprim domain-containing protein [Methanosarcinaceae archaeon]
MSYYQKHLKLFEAIVDELIKRSKDGAIIIVEGKRDVIALEKLGISGRIEIATHQSLLVFAESFANDTVPIIILTDWDRRGNILADKITTYLKNIGIMPDLLIRKRINTLVKKEIKDVESLHTYMMNLRKTTGQVD